MKGRVSRVRGALFPWGNFIFEVLLLFVNSVGIVGALAQVLELPWRQAPKSGMMTGEGSLEGIVFWGGILLFCAGIAFLQMNADRKRTLTQAIICAMAYILCGLFFRNAILEGLAVAMENAAGNLNQRYQLHIALTSGVWLPDAAEWTEGVKMWCVTLSTLYLFLPLVLAGGFLGRRFRGIWLLAGNILWFYAACVCDRFPDTILLTVCVLGLMAALIQQNFGKNTGAGLWAVICAVTVTGGIMAVSFRFLMPVLDVQYEAIREDRELFYRFVNGDWLSALQSTLARMGFGAGVDVTGALNRTNAFSYASTPVYRVTADGIPQGTLYLKGFVGKDYGGKAWAAAKDKALIKYYREHDMELPEKYNDLVNISYEAGRALGRNTDPGHIGIEELGGRGSYSLYPSGALLTDEFRVHGDGSVARRGSRYEFSYYYLTGSPVGSTLSGKWADMERQYAQYVYDNFLEYDEEALPRLTEGLEQEKIRAGSVYTCALDIMNFLHRQANYNLDAERNPAGTDFVEYFLFESHEGYCVHFASAGVLAFRYFGIPARYAAGYAVPRSNFSGNSQGSYTAEVTGQMAHAWVEIYLDQIGWVPVEVTPGTAVLSGNNRLEQLDYVGQLSGQRVMIADDADRREKDRDTQPSEEVSGEEPEPEGWPEFEDWMSSAGTAEPEKRPETGQEDPGEQEKPWNGEKYPSASSGEEPGRGNVQAGEVGAGQISEGEHRDYTPLFRVPCCCLGCGALPAAAVYIYRTKQRRRYRLFRRLGTGERIFWLYGNLRRTLRFAGCPRELPVDEEAFWQRLKAIFRQVSREEYDTFCMILEKNSFAGEEPSYEEYMAVCALHDRLVKKIYDGAPVYKKVLIGKYWDMCKEGA